MKKADDLIRQLFVKPCCINLLATATIPKRYPCVVIVVAHQW